MEYLSCADYLEGRNQSAVATEFTAISENVEQDRKGLPEIRVKMAGGIIALP
jgi:hypothetical protein